MGSYDLVIAGLGLRVGQLTSETIDALRSSRAVFYVGKAPGLSDVLKQYCSETIDLATAYREDVDRFETYKHMAAIVVDAAIAGPPVVLAMYGHPLILSQPSVLALRTAARLGLRTKVLPAVSALDCLFADLGVDPIEAGLQMHEATELLLRQRPLIPEMAAVIWQVGTLETRLYTGTKRSRPERLLRFRDYLLRYYPADHIVFSVASSTDAVNPPQVHRMRIRDLPANSRLLHMGTTLYIPPASHPPIVDTELMESLTSLSRLHALVD